MRALAFAVSRHTPARSGAAGVISLLGGFGGPHPHFGRFDLSRETNENKNELVPIKKTIRLFPQPRVWLGISSLIKAVLQDLQFLQRDEAAIHHSVKNGQKLIYLLFRIHDFDDQWQIQR